MQIYLLCKRYYQKAGGKAAQFFLQLHFSPNQVSTGTLIIFSGLPIFLGHMISYTYIFLGGLFFFFHLKLITNAIDGIMALELGKTGMSGKYYNFFSDTIPEFFFYMSLFLFFGVLFSFSCGIFLFLWFCFFISDIFFLHSFQNENQFYGKTVRVGMIHIVGCILYLGMSLLLPSMIFAFFLLIHHVGYLRAS